MQKHYISTDHIATRQPSMKSVLARIIYWLSIVYLLYLMGTLACVLVFDHEALVSWYTKHYPNAYSINDYATRYFTSSHYDTVYRWAPFLMLALSSILLWLFINMKAVHSGIGRLWSEGGEMIKVISDSLSNLSARQRALLISAIALLLMIKVYLLATLPYQIDEAFNFIYFVHQGPIHVTTFSNNHVLYNLITTVWWRLIPEPIIASRITSVFSGLFINILIYAITRSFYDYRAALFMMMVTGLTFWTNVFSAQGYSYMLMTLFWLISVTALFLSRAKQRGGHALCIACFVLGFYCTKLFVIPFASIIIFWIILTIHQRETITKLVVIRIGVTIFATSVLSTLLYLPMWVWSGSDALFAIDIANHDLLSKAPILLESFSMTAEVNSRSYFIIGSCVLLGLICFKRLNSKLQMLLILNLATFIALFVFIMIRHVYPPARSLIFMNILFYATVSAVAVDFLLRFSSRAMATNSILLVLTLTKVFGSISIFNSGWQKMPQSFQDTAFYRKLDGYVSCIMKYKPSTVCNLECDHYLDTYLKLAAVKQKKHIVVNCAAALTSGCDVVIVNDSPVQSDHYTQIINSDEFGSVFLNSGLLKGTQNSGEVCK
ncbi:MAG: hypothetical protein ABI477_03365 [Chryseolinea sp.]